MRKRWRTMAAGWSLLGMAAAGLAQTPQAPTPASAHNPWWSGAAIYEIYPRSYADSNGDGVGDLNGITQHLDYLQWLGVDAIWITPFFPSPLVDFGYDIADYQAIDPQFGTMADFTRLQDQASRHGIRVIMDMVLNHTSDQHAWFKESASSRTNAKADWYVWNDGLPADAPNLTSVQRGNVHEGRVPPNNWTSLFGGSAWTWVPARKQFYYHKFYVQQPDLNWRNPAVEKAMFAMMRFWLDRGVAGFRLDAIPNLFEDPQLRNEPETGGTDAYGEPNLNHIYTDNLDEIHGVIKRMRALVDSYPGNRVLIGETYLPDTAAIDRWYGGAAHDELNLAMNTLVGFSADARYSTAHFRPLLAAAQSQLHGSMPLFVFDNHDQRRAIDRFGDGTHDIAMAKGLAAILTLSRATALTYYGAPLGMRTATPARKEDVRDPIGIAGWPREKGRDGERTPMQWTPGPQAGFSTNPRTWLPVNPNHATINVETEKATPDSLLLWYRTLLGLRRTIPALASGDMRMVGGDDPDVLAWVRTDAAEKRPVLVAINMSAKPRTLAPGGLDPTFGKGGAEVLAASGGAAVQANGLTLPPFAIWVGRAAR